MAEASTKTPGATLRDAATSMRDRAALVRPDEPWRRDRHRIYAETPDGGTFGIASWSGVLGDPEPIIAHVSSWHPVVAVAVADWLDNEAAVLAERKAPPRAGSSGADALAVARAYLNE